jgi:hypothetical protein
MLQIPLYSTSKLSKIVMSLVNTNRKYLQLTNKLCCYMAIKQKTDKAKTDLQLTNSKLQTER